MVVGIITLSSYLSNTVKANKKEPTSDSILGGDTLASLTGTVLRQSFKSTRRNLLRQSLTPPSGDKVWIIMWTNYLVTEVLGVPAEAIAKVAISGRGFILRLTQI